MTIKTPDCKQFKRQVYLTLWVVKWRKMQSLGLKAVELQAAGALKQVTA